MADTLYPDYEGGRLNRQVRDFLLGLAVEAPVPVVAQSPEEVRALNSIEEWVVRRVTPRRVEDIVIPGTDAAIRARVYVPGGDGPYPVVVYFHGGGWVFGSLDEADHICGSICMGTPAVVVSVDYRLSPEHKCPCAIEDAYESVTWVAREIGRFGGDQRRIAVAGESAGANMATVVSLMARDRGGPEICYQLLLCPWVDLAHLDRRSYELFGDGPWLSRTSIEYYRAQYLRSGQQTTEPYVSPLLAPSLTGLPPALVVTAEFDVLRDEGEAYARRLQEHGSVATFRRYEGVIHSFFLLNKVFDCADEALGDFIAALRADLAP